MRKIAIAFCAACLFQSGVIYAAGTDMAPAPVVGAKSSVTYPGSVWTTNGTLSPVEKGNFISLSHVEQGVQFKGYFELFGTGTVSADSKRFDWNNKVVGGVGVRFNQTIGSGVVRVGVQYLDEKRTISKSNASGVAFTADAYFQWGR